VERLHSTHSIDHPRFGIQGNIIFLNGQIIKRIKCAETVGYLCRHRA